MPPEMTRRQYLGVLADHLLAAAADHERRTAYFLRIKRAGQLLKAGREAEALAALEAAGACPPTTVHPAPEAIIRPDPAPAPVPAGTPGRSARPDPEQYRRLQEALFRVLGLR